MTRSESEESVVKRLNDPDVLKAFATLIVAGLIVAPARAEIFCAYCGEHICYDLAQKPKDGIQSDFVREEVAAHRAECAEYQSQVRGAAFEEDLKKI